MKQRTIAARILSVLLTLTLLLGTSTVMAASQSLTDLTDCQNWPSNPLVESECAILVEAKTGNILYAKNANETCYPASITKVMTALVTLEKCSRDETLEFSYRATHELEPGSTHIARTEGEILSVNDCLYALLLASANEVAQGLAEHVSGTIEDFSAEMTKRAEELGCTHTNFTNPSGLNDENHYTTCHDMAVIMRAAIQNPDFLEIDSTLTYTIPATNKHEEALPIAMKHQMLKKGAEHYDGAVAGKTGYTTIAGNTLVTYAVRGDLELICVVMRSNGTHYTDTKTLLDYGFNEFAAQQLSQTNAVSSLKETALQSGKITEDELNYAYIPEDEWIVLPKSLDISDLNMTTEAYQGTLEEGDGLAAPIAVAHYTHKGTTLATAYLEVKEPETPEETMSADLENQDDSKKKTSFFSKVITFLKSHFIKIIIALIGLIILLLLFLRLTRRRRRGYSSYSSFGRRRRRRRRGRRRRFRRY